MKAIRVIVAVGCALVMQASTVQASSNSILPATLAGSAVLAVPFLLHSQHPWARAIRRVFYTDRKLQKAVWKGDVVAVKESLDDGADLDAELNSKTSVLGLAARYGRLEVVKLLLEAGSKTTCRSGQTPLHEAASGGHMSIVQELIKAGVRVNAANAGGRRPLHEAVCHGHPNLVGVLLEAGADSNARDKHGRTPLHMAAERDNFCLSPLLAAGGEVNATDKRGWRPLDYALERYCRKAFRALIRAGAKPEAVFEGLPRPLQRVELSAYVGWELQVPKKQPRTTADGKKHYQVIFLIDQESSGGIFTQGWEAPILDDQLRMATKLTMQAQETSLLKTSVQGKDAFFKSLLMHIASDNKLMVVSKGLAYGLIALSHEGSAEVKRAIEERWVIYSVPKTHFIVWVPRDYLDHYATILKLSSFEQLSTSTKDEILRYCPSALAFYTDRRLKEMQRVLCCPQDLEKIFDFDGLQDESGVCDVFVGGHGCSGSTGCVAGLRLVQDRSGIREITSLLSFLNDYLNAGTVCIQSCSAGGQNASLMRTKRDGTLIDNKYVLIVLSLTDKVTKSKMKQVVSWTSDFFDFALEFDQLGHRALERFTKTIVSAQRVPDAEGDPHGYAAFPQVWLPGNLEYQARGATNDVYTVGRVPARIAAEQGRSIELKDRQVALWYPKIVNASVNVVPARINVEESKLSRYRFGLELSTAEECLDTSLLKPELDHIHANYSTLASLLRMHGKNTMQRWMEQAREHLYPEFILMGGTAHRRLQLKNVVAKGGGNPLMGVLRFLRDSFASTPWDSPDQKDILIGSLEGINDVPFHMETAAERSERPSPTSLYEKVRATAGQKITLKNVMVRINAPEHLGKIAFYVPLDGQWWLYTVSLKRSDDSSARAWDFKPTTAPAIEAFKKAIDAHVVPVGRIAAKFGGTNSTVS